MRYTQIKLLSLFVIKLFLTITSQASPCGLLDRALLDIKSSIAKPAFPRSKDSLKTLVHFVTISVRGMGFADPDQAVKKNLTTTDGKKVRAFYYLKGRQHALDQGLIFEVPIVNCKYKKDHIPTALIQTQPSETRPAFNFAFLEGGILVFALVTDGVELGVKHLHLANMRDVLMGGEIRMAKDRARFLFNFNSKTFMQHIFQSNQHLSKEQFKDLMQWILQKLLPKDKDVEYTDDVLLPNHIPPMSHLQSLHNKGLVIIPENWRP